MRVKGDCYTKLNIHLNPLYALKIIMNTRNVLLAVLAAATLSGCGNPAHQMIVDAKVDELCAKDGKAIVYEKEVIPLSAAKIAVAKERIRPADTHYYVSMMSRVPDTAVGGIPNITKSTTQLFRVSDNHLLGERQFFFREGGDFLPGHPSGYGCPAHPESALVNAVFSEGITR